MGVFQKMVTWPLLSLLLLIFGAALIAGVGVWYWCRYSGGTAFGGKKSKESAPRHSVDQGDRMQRMENLIRAQESAIDSLEEQVADAVKMRHDFRRELLALQEFARRGERDAVEQYLPQVNLEDKVMYTPLCGNRLVDVLLQYYRKTGDEAGVAMDISVEAENDLWLNAADMGVLLGNLLENGVTAAAEAEPGQRRLRLRTMQTGSLFSIAMGNTFGQPRLPEDEGFASTKEGHRGVGLRSIAEIAERFDGVARFHVEGDLFMSYILLFRPGEPVSAVSHTEQ